VLICPGREAAREERDRGKGKKKEKKKARRWQRGEKRRRGD